MNPHPVQGDYSLSIKYGIVKHIKINRHGNKYDVAPDAKQFPSIQELVEHFQCQSLNRHFPGMETTLETPYRDALVAQSSESGSSLGRCRSRFAYTAKSHDELSFEVGPSREPRGGCWRRVVRDGARGC